MYYIGIVGHAEEKFIPETKKKAISIIKSIISSGINNYGQNGIVIVSGASPMGGIDTWAEEWSEYYTVPKLIFPPVVHDWERGFKPRNLLIAKYSDIIHCIVVSKLPKNFKGMRFEKCYHCNTTDHIKSGGCWTAHRAKKAEWHII